MTARITVACAGGIGDDSLGGMLSGITRHLDRAKYDVVRLESPQSYGPVPGPRGVSFDQSLRVLDSSIELKLVVSRVPVVLMGYSAGAAGIGDTVARLVRERSTLVDRIAAVVLVADPRRPSGDGLPGHGVAGNRPIPGAPFPVIWVSDPRDPICCCTSEALRTVADQSSAFSLVDPITWGRDIRDRLATNRWQEVTRLRIWELPKIVQRYRIAVEHLARYPHEHVLYGARVWPGTGLPYLHEAARRVLAVTA
ncbi:hypothetical protein DW322_11155 [Rhodococcus rhodnii]|uniref:AB hydrolase-1 domain-containing protein n=2 Tax=Rhodococcus rhodnii TaxID=38312 RepID=R7WRY0_9NOCA|nr:hypothetical protein [Rhodococcus rhodnii]EOM78040.1 hypothetical protein Rrhod_0581 [Rhodococcus rhodnii LMG 5362]TXG90669.1 hypothetical protein DW322_11155 [Rhodococcus rhodnii]